MFKTEARDLIVQTFKITEERACNFLKSSKIKWTSDQKRMLEKYSWWLEQSIGITVDVVDSVDNKTVAVGGRQKKVLMSHPQEPRNID